MLSQIEEMFEIAQEMLSHDSIGKQELPALSLLTMRGDVTSIGIYTTKSTNGGGLQSL